MLKSIISMNIKLRKHVAKTYSEKDYQKSFNLQDQIYQVAVFTAR